MLHELRPAFTMIVLMTALTGLVYPLAMTEVAGSIFPHQAGGSLIVADGKTIGSELIGQAFTGDQYFHGRPSAISSTDAQNNSTPDPYDPTASSGSNLGPTSQALVYRVKGDTAALSATNAVPVPIDLVTTSASGLDPHITPAGAMFQVNRVAKAHGLSTEAVEDLISQATHQRTFGLLGEPYVNILELNLIIDKKAAN